MEVNRLDQTHIDLLNYGTLLWRGTKNIIHRINLALVHFILNYIGNKAELEEVT